MKTPLAESLGLNLTGVTPRVRLISLIVIAMELDHLRRELGYAGGGAWQQFRSETLAGQRLTWSELVKQNAGIDTRTAENYLKCSRVIRERLLAGEGKVELMDAQPSKLTPDQRNALIDSIGMALKEGDGPTSLRREFNRREPLIHGENRLLPSGSSGIISPEELQAMEMAARMRGIWPADLAGQAALIAAIAMADGQSREDADRVAQMILLDQGRGFPSIPE